MNLVTPKVGAKHELLFNKPASGLTLWYYLSQSFRCSKNRGGFVDHISRSDLNHILDNYEFGKP
jgi:hypothetical protein